MFLSKQAQSLCLANSKRSSKHQGATEEKEHGTSRLQLYPLQQHDRRISVSPSYRLPFRRGMLESNWNYALIALEGSYRFFLHGGHHHNEMDNLANEERPYFQQ